MLVRSRPCPGDSVSVASSHRSCAVLETAIVVPEPSGTVALAVILSTPVFAPAYENVALPVLSAGMGADVWGFAPVTVNVTSVPPGFFTIAVCAVNICDDPMRRGATPDGRRNSCGMTGAAVHGHVPSALVTRSIVRLCVA